MIFFFFFVSLCFASVMNYVDKSYLLVHLECPFPALIINRLHLLCVKYRKVILFLLPPSLLESSL